MKHIALSFAALLVVSTLATAQEFKHYDEGVAKFKSEDYDFVIDTFTKILADPKHSKRLDEGLHFYRGQAYYHKDEYDKALIDLDASLTLNHYNKGIIYWYKARCYDKQKKFSEAEHAYKEALQHAEKNKKTSAQILADRAQFYARQGNRESAQQDIEMARSLDPSNADLSKLNVNTTANPPASQEKKNTQVIVQKNTPQQQKQTEKTSTSQVTQPPQVHENTSLVASLADLYKDEKRYALVIGNGNYPAGIGTLRNPVNDATDIATELRRSKFEVQLLTNATYVQIREAMRKFQEKLTEGPVDQTVGLFYYAGHGVQFQDENYLVPVDADVRYEDDIVRMCFPVQRMVLANMERTNSRMNIVILDACRNNPFPAATRSVTQGLAEMKRARGSFIAYATAPGSIASDGSGRNGLYTQELLKAIRKPGLTIEQVFKEVRMNVMRLSGDKQFTWDSSNIIGEFYFKFP